VLFHHAWIWYLAHLICNTQDSFNSYFYCFT